MKLVLHLVCFSIWAAMALSAQDAGAGEAGYYSDWFAGKRMANGELVNQDELTASISNYPFDTKLRIHSLDSDKVVVVRVTDRPGPASNELIVVTRAAADQLGFVDQGRARVEIEVIEMGDGRSIEVPTSDSSAKERRWKRGGLAAPGKKPSPFAYSEP
jgi:rare lipoprotein A